MNEDSPVDNADDDEEGSKGVQSSEGKEPDVATEEAEENVTTEEDGEDVATRRESTPLNFSRDANGESDEEIICSNCQEYVNKIHDVDELKLCSTCFYYLKATNTMRPSRELTSRKKIKLPADMVGIVAGFHNSARKIEEPMYDIEEDYDDNEESVV
uniref:Transcription factor IIIB 90 kDa subunit n=1 Tax=Steinernema glaseri TaxID=37863 RepID=A0A1I7XYK4_9BILA